MNGRSIAIAAAAALIAMPAGAAERATARSAPAAAQPAAEQAPTVLASAADVKLPASLKPQAAAAPAKRPRTARVTTCRCGEPAPQ